ncbi:MAG: ATP-binding protein [Clostridiales bacterium]|nr:ATP-binding protein [Clostridiales bacterium]
MDTKKLMNLIKKEEGTKLDFKLLLDIKSESGKKEFAKDVCAIANSTGGRGYLIIGIADKSKEIIGIDKKDIFTEEKIQQIISTRCEPPIPIKVDFIDIDGKTIGIITIYDGNQRPYQIKETGAFHIRRGSTTDVMRKYEILKAFEYNLDLFVETLPIMKSNIDFLNMDLVNKYFMKKGIYINKDNKSFLLESAGITYRDRDSNQEKCTYGGLVVFSNINSICISNNMIRIINKINNKEEEVNIIQGDLLMMIKKSEELITKIIPTNYPIVPIIEGIKNAVLYRDYTEINRIIEVVITPNSIVIESPGERIEKNTNGKNERYYRRNMWIYEKLMTLDDENIFINDGRGFHRIKAAFKDRKNVKVRFVNSKTEESFKVILPGVN